MLITQWVITLALLAPAPVAPVDSPNTGWVHPFDFPQAKQAPAEIFAVIEITAGSFTKYEIDPNNGHLVVDRFQSMPVAYPANYGGICRTLAGDGDPLDVLVYSREPIVPGAIIRVRPVGILRSVDGGEQDDKVLAVPASKIDPTFDAIQNFSDLPEIELQRLEAFFRVYKQLPEGRKVVELGGFEGVEAARSEIQASLDRFEADRAGN